MQHADNYPGNNSALAGAMLWIACIQFLVVQFIVHATIPGYSLKHHDISAMGISACRTFAEPAGTAPVELCSPLHPLFNTSLALLAPLIIAGALLTWRVWPRKRLSSAGLFLLIIGGAGAFAAGIWPMDTARNFHIAGAALHFLTTPLGILLLGIAVLRQRPALGLFSLACGALILAGFFLYGTGVYLELGRGGMERVAGWTSTLWFTGTGFVLFRSARRAREPLES